MTESLSPLIHTQIFEKLRSIFSDLPFFDQLVADKLKLAIRDSNNIEINVKTTKKVVERYFDVASFKSPEQKMVLAQIGIIFKSAYVLIISYRDYPSSFFITREELLESYPQFVGLDEEETKLLLNFRNMLRITLLLIPARLNKQLILKIAGRLEGSQNEYITGGGQKKEVQRRVTIYETEGGVRAEKRPERRRLPKDTEDPFISKSINNNIDTSVLSNITGQKRSGSTLSDKKAKSVRLASDEVKYLKKDPILPFPELKSNNAIPEVPSADFTMKKRNNENCHTNNGFDRDVEINPFSPFAALHLVK